MVLSWELATVGVAATGILAGVSVAGGALTPVAAALAAAFGAVIVVLGGFPYLALLALFVLGSSLATRYRFEEKRRNHLQEGRSGERGVSNVLAHILIPTGLVVASVADPRGVTAGRLAVLYTSAIAFGAADTFASEFGVLSHRAVSIVTGRAVPAGTNGGVSAWGELSGLLGAGSTALIGAGVFVLFGTAAIAPGLFVLAAMVAGFLACQVDSVLGWTLENRGYLTKGSTNFLAMLSAVGIAVVFLAFGAGVA